MPRYRVIWFDDEHASLNIIREKAFLNDIELVGFDNAKQGIEELERNIKSYDAALIDGLFFLSSDESGTPSSDKALFNVAMTLEKLASFKKLPWFILSGQTSFTKGKNRFADVWKDNEVYDKLNDDQLMKLWTDIKSESEKQIETQIRFKYRKVFAVCTAKYIGDDAQNILLEVLKEIENPALNFDDELYFTQLRMILESMFRAANRIGLLHDNCLKGGKVNLTESSLFMSGEQTKHLDVKCKKVHFSKLLSNNVKSILFITGAASHTVDPDLPNNINLTEYRKSLNTPYLLYSLAFQLMDILIWFKKYVDEHPDKEANRSLWESLITSAPKGEWIKGEIIRIADNGYGTFQPLNGGKTLSIIPAKVKEHNLYSQQMIEVITKLDGTGTKTLIENIRII
jgi:hypothetical protein